MSSIVSAVTGAITGNAGGAGANFQANQATLTDPVTKAQLEGAQQNTQMGLAQQQDFIKALQAQNGIQNQSNVFDQMQGIANGAGPNPAQAMLANSTGQNVANQAALMAGQRGSSANTGMIARQAAMQGSNIQQQAAGQGAALQANQSLSAIGQMGSMANQQVGQQANATQAYNQNAIASQGQILGATGQNNATRVSNVAQANSANAGIANTVTNQQGNLMGNLLNAAGTAAVLMAADGGEVKEPSVWDNIKSSMDDPKPSGGNAHPLNPSAVKGFESAFASGGKVGPQSKVGQHFHGIKPMPKAMMAEGGPVQALVSPGEKYLDPKSVQKVKQGADPLKEGETIPGKAKVKGAKNSYANDTVPKTLEEGGIVLPRSVTQAKNPEWAAHKFVAAILKQKALKGK